MIAVGAYIRTLRQERGLSQEELARLLDTSQKQVSRWENGEHRPIGETLHALVLAVQGNTNDVTALLADSGATPEHGEEAARRWLNTHPNDQQAIARFFTRQPPCQVCGETTWRVGATIASFVVGSDGKPQTLGPYRIMLQIVCRTCGHLILFDTGEAPGIDLAAMAAGLGLPAPE